MGLCLLFLFKSKVSSSIEAFLDLCDLLESDDHRSAVNVSGKLSVEETSPPGIIESAINEFNCLNT